MIIGVPTEKKNTEFRVGLTPDGVHELTRHGHRVLVETGAGIGSGFPDADYARSGAQLLPEAAEVWSQAELIVKVKEPIAEEYGFFRPGLVLFAYLHLAAEPELARALLDAGVTAIAFETVRAADRSLPLLAPMSEIAGRLSVIEGAHVLTAPGGGRGILLGGVPGVAPAHVVVIGAGVAGTNAATMAIGLGARVTILDVNLDRLKQLDERFGAALTTLASTARSVETAVVDADLVIGSVLIPGDRAPKLVTDAMVARMRPGSVLVDIAVDQGGCFEGSRPTTHDDPTFPVHDTLYYCVANMPGAVPATSTAALTNATLPYVLRLADRGAEAACAADPGFAEGLNIAAGAVRNAAVASALGRS